jgi:phosphomannomutase/phosphoglucomutase
MLKTAFRKYDIRGIVGAEILIEEINYCMLSLCYLIKKNFKNVKTICIARDGRTHSYEIHQKICKSLIDQGFSIIDLGLVPTPVHAFAMHRLKIEAGLMITASHNNGQYNGIKITINHKPFFDKSIRSIKYLFKAKIEIKNNTIGKHSNYNIVPEYLDFIEKHFEHLKGFDKKIAIDASNGATGNLISQLCERMKWDTKLINTEIDGTFPGHDPDPTKKTNTLELTRICINEDRLGLALDGDGDRAIAISENGRHIVGDDLSALFCKKIAQDKPGSTIVVDIKCSNTIVEWLRSLNFKVVITPCGHGFIVDAMEEHDAVFGGELSCHFCFNDRYLGIDDGIYAACRIIELCKDTKENLEELYNQLPERYLSDELRVPCPENLKNKIVEQLIKYTKDKTNYNVNTLDGLFAYNNFAATTIRKSNTESVLSIRFEGTKREHLQKITQEYYQELCSKLPAEKIKYLFESYL